ncbi:MAG: MAPEG family protein [Gammaproteobacteria bacterium]
MAFEMLMLACVSVLFAFAWLPAWVCRYQSYRWRWLLSNRSTAQLMPLPEWGQRAERAYNNLKENFPVFAVAILLLSLSGGFNQGTRLAAALFVMARLVHMPAYIVGSVWLRSLSWLMGWLATLYLLGVALAGMLHF